MDKLRIANCRGVKPVLNDINKARIILGTVSVELNSCEAREYLKEAERLLTKVIECSNEYVIVANKVVKRKIKPS